jgi:hypothetical protein
LRVVRGNATPEELAGLVAVLLARSADDEDAAPAPPRSAWSDRAARLRRPLFSSPGAWRRSSFPG